MYKKLFQSLRSFRKNSILTVIFIALEVAMEIMIPFLMAKIIDKGFETKDISYIIKIGSIMFFCALFSMTAGVLSGKFSSEAAAGFSRNIRKDVFDAIQTFSFGNMDKFSTPSLITRLTTDITNIQMAYQMVLKIIVRAPLMLLFSFGMALIINARLALTILAAIPLLGGALIFIVIKVHPIFLQVFKKYDFLNQIVQENINGIRVVKSFVREREEVKKFHVASEEVKKYFVKAEKILALNSPVMQFAIYTCMLLISWFGAKFIVAGSMTTGELMSFIAYLMQILSSLMMISMIFVMVVISEASIERVVEVLEEKSDLSNGPQPIYELENGAVTFEQVSFKYDPKAAKNDLENLDFTILSGETIGIIGGTGSGKSSLVQLIPRLYDVVSGVVKVGGKSVRDYDLATLREEIAVVLQKNTLFSGTILENLRWGNEKATLAEVQRACQLAQADSFIQEFPDKYETLIDQGGSNVSGGQKQRLCIARALLKKPKILILDDSTSAVDTKTDSLIRKAFREEIPETTKIIVGQRISSIEDADKIIVLHEGQVNGIGTHEELLRDNVIYQEVYYSQKKGVGMDE